MKNSKRIFMVLGEEYVYDEVLDDTVLRIIGIGRNVPKDAIMDGIE